MATNRNGLFKVRFPLKIGNIAQQFCQIKVAAPLILLLLQGPFQNGKQFKLWGVGGTDRTAKKRGKIPRRHIRILVAASPLPLILKGTAYKSCRLGTVCYSKRNALRLPHQLNISERDEWRRRVDLKMYVP